MERCTVGSCHACEVWQCCRMPLSLRQDGRLQEFPAAATQRFRPGIRQRAYLLAERADTVQGACRQPPSRSPLLRPSRPVRRRAVPCRTTLRRQACCLEVLWACALHGPTCKPLHQAPARPQLQAHRLHGWGSLMTGSWRCGMPAGDGNHPRPLLLCMSEARGQPEVLSHCGHEHLLLHRR